MKKSIAIAIITLVGLHARAAEDNKPNDRPAGERPGLSRLDKNGDQVITKEEAGSEIWERLGKMDKNGDGKIEKSEMVRRGGPGGPGGERGDFVKRIDKDGDGNVSKEEAGKMWERFGEFDKDGNNLITREEFAAGFRERMNPENLFTNLDQNKDGKITESEAPKMWERLNRADKNEDGSVSKEEMLAAAKMRSEMMKGRGKGMMAQGKGGPRPGGPTPIFGKYDENKDGKLTKEEVPEELWSKISRADENADGTVSMKELGAVYQRGKSKGRPADPASGDASPKRPDLDKEA